MFSANETARILIVADDPLVRAGLALMLEQQPDSEVVGQVDEAAWPAAENDGPTPLDVYQPDVVLWDMGWETDEERFNMLAAAEMETPVVALLADVGMVAAAWTVGARGLLPREVAVENVSAALQAVLQGLVVIDQAYASALLPPPEPAQVAALTVREMEVLRLVEGLTNRAIGPRLNISEHTVKFHVAAIMSKLGAQSRTEAVVRATRLGMLHL